MKIKNLGVVAALLPVVAIVAYAKPGKPTPIVFPKGKKSVTVTGSLATSKSKVYFTMPTKKGEKYELKVDAQGPAVVMIRFADGTEDGAPGGIETQVSKTGLSRIEVHGSDRGGLWKGKFTLTVKKL